MSGSRRAQAQAEARQREASDPAVSAFVSASAGSGKTKLLIDRLLRLLLGGVEPSRVLCLTFTKAAAAEMRLRLQSRLGDWVGLDDAALDGKLLALQQVPSEAMRRRARELFVRVLDLPGGMRIDTIHAFCQSLLRRFPLEARLSPHFRLVDDALGLQAMREARETMLAGMGSGGVGLAGMADEAMRDMLDHVAGLSTLMQFGQRVADLRLDGNRLEALLAHDPVALRAAQRAALGVTAEHEDEVVAGAVAWADEPALLSALRQVAAQGSSKVAENAAAMLEWLGCAPEDRAENWAHWHGLFHTGAGKPSAPSRLVNDRLEATHGLRAPMLAEQQRLAAVEDHRIGIAIARVSHALLTLAGPVIAAYAARKDAAALLDYDDLIGLTTRLLVDPGAAWVLYKLDGGIDHLLLDEVQDTAPAQWEIAGALTREFFAGSGARDVHRTVFAVGDRKQSIFSFQGADPDQFDRWRDILGKRVADAGKPPRHVELDVSFRSTAPVLTLVDAVFAHPLAAAGVAESGMVHIANRADQAGRVELWPLAPRPVADPPEPWTVPDRNLGTVSGPQRLADAIAGWIARSCGTVPLESHGRMLEAGDVLVLVRRRNAFARSLVRALKAQGVPVAGLDRLVLTDQPAVADLLALGDTLLLPEDSLSLACVLTSPLGGLTDDALMDLAALRRGSLWDALRARAHEREDFQAAHDFVAALLARVDFVGPHALLAEALGPLGGRARLLARLGAEAAEPIDELLNAALAYAGANPPSLQGFLHALRQSGAEVKREAEGSGAAVRIMTVHGAKGLQAPVVFLPDTTALPPEGGPLVWAELGAEHGKLKVPLWSPRKELRNAAIDTLRAEARRRSMAEHNRLLYVALTRAEDRLIVCGWEPRTLAEESWYALVREGFLAAGAEAEAFSGIADPWDGNRLALETPQTGQPDHARPVQAAAPVADLPVWTGRAPQWQPTGLRAEPALPAPLAPSRPDNAGLGPVPQAASPLAERDTQGQRFDRGRRVHALLQHLPDLPPPDRRAAALAWLAAGDVGDAAALADAALAILDHPLLAPLFGPLGRAEVPLTGVVDGMVIGGLVDRLAVLDDRVLVADYKTNRNPPRDLATVPPLYLRQMAAYRAVLRVIFPGRPVQCALVWTTGARVMPLPDTLLDAHAPDANGAA